ncbi:MAG: helix-turn-helix transcriptional regulator [Lactimicrobium sp.]|uniref:helix-turn-helix domain-containing protein n=1 Tax=Lactimicrobium sp. TaxID=2563780 RepID=UPI002F350095
MSEKDVRIGYAAARINAGYEQSEAAKLLGISMYTLSNYERGRTIPNWDMHNKMAELYRIPKEMLCPPKK